MVKRSPRAPSGVAHSPRALFKIILRDPQSTRFLSTHQDNFGNDHRRSLLQVKILVCLARPHIMVLVTHSTPQALSFLKRSMWALLERTPQPPRLQ